MISLRFRQIQPLCWRLSLRLKWDECCKKWHVSKNSTPATDITDDSKGTDTWYFHIYSRPKSNKIAIVFRNLLLHKTDVHLSYIYTVTTHKTKLENTQDIIKKSTLWQTSIQGQWADATGVGIILIWNCSYLFVQIDYTCQDMETGKRDGKKIKKRKSLNA